MMKSERMHQDGATLIVMLLILVIGGAAIFTSKMASRNNANTRVHQKADVLAEAKEALLGYALTHYDSNAGEYGYLPCPDINTSTPAAEGEEHGSSCGGQYITVFGRLPWKTLGLKPATHDGSECIWYAVSGNHKNAVGAKSEMLNTDTNGQLQIFASDGTAIIAGNSPDERVVAALFAPGPTLPGQTRTSLGSGVDHCRGNYAPANYLDSDNGINNAALTALPDTVDQFIASGNAANVNDQVLFITRAELEQHLTRRIDTQTKLNALTQVIAECIADYGKKNPGGATDLRLPWPAPVDLADYRSTNEYDDSALGVLSGRVSDAADDSNAQTANAIANVITGCSTTDVPAWTAEMATLWSNWKDHLFVAVADAFKPDATVPTACGTCLTVNGAGSYAAIVMLAGSRLAAVNQQRDAPPLDTDLKNNVNNFLEGRNASNHPNLAGDGNYQSSATSATFNDVLYCIDPTLSVSPC